MKIQQSENLEVKSGKRGWLVSFYDRFEKSIVTIYILNYISNGMMVFLMLMIKDLMKSELGAGPDDIQIVTSILMIPWSIKIFYGLLSDNFPINGYKRKSYLVFNGFLGFAMMMLLFPKLFTSITTATVFLFFTMVSAASTDVLADCLMVVECRKDEARGSEDFQTLGFGTYSLFGIFGAIGGAFIT